MKKILALVLALILGLSSVGAVADDYTATLDFDFPTEQLLSMASIAMDEETLSMAQIMLPIINQLDLQLVAVDEQIQFNIVAKDTSIASLALGMQGDQFVVVSDLFPSYYLSVSMETVMALMEEAAAAMPQMDEDMEEALENALENFSENWATQLHNYAGQLENGNFVVNGESFTAKIPVNITLEELGILGLNLVKDIIADPSLATLGAMLELNASDLDVIIAQLQETAKTDPQPCDLAFYGRQNAQGELGDDMAITFATTEDNQLLALSMLILDDRCSGSVVVGDSSNSSFEKMYTAAMSGTQEALTLEWNASEGKDDSFNLDITLCAMGMYFSLKADGSEAKNGYVQNTAIFFPVPDFPIFTYTFTVEEGEKDPLPISTSGKTAITVEEIMNDPYAAEEKLEGLKLDVSAYGLPSVLAKLIAAMPDEASALMTKVILLQQGQELPATQATETVAPYIAPATAVPAPTAEPAKTNQNPGGGFMNVIRSTEEPVATPIPAPTQVPINNGFFGKPQ